MNLAELYRIEELIDAHGGLQAAIANRRATIARRAAEGKTSPLAERNLELLLALSPGFLTSKQAERAERDRHTCRD